MTESMVVIILSLLVIGADVGFYAETPWEIRGRYPWYLRWLPGSGFVLFVIYKRSFAAKDEKENK